MWYVARTQQPPMQPSGSSPGSSDTLTVSLKQEGASFQASAQRLTAASPVLAQAVAIARLRQHGSGQLEISLPSLPDTQVVGLLTLLHQDQPGAALQRMSFTTLQDTAKAAARLQCTHALELLDVRLAELCPGAVDAANAQICFQLAVGYGLSHFQHACARWILDAGSYTSWSELRAFDLHALLKTAAMELKQLRSTADRQKAAHVRAETIRAELDRLCIIERVSASTAGPQPEALRNEALCLEQQLARSGA